MIYQKKLNRVRSQLNFQRSPKKQSKKLFVIPCSASHVQGPSNGSIFIRDGITGDPFRRSEFRRADSIIRRYCSLVKGIVALFTRRALIKTHCLSLHTSLGTDLTQSADFLTNQIRSLLFCRRTSGSGGIIVHSKG